MKPLLNVEEAAKRAGMSVEELLFSRARWLPPGNLGFKETPGGPLVWRSVDLLKTPEAREKVLTEAAEAVSLTCDQCGFIAKTGGGLASHQRKHET